jgi:hypothetical protein
MTLSSDVESARPSWRQRGMTAHFLQDATFGFTAYSSIT